MIALSYSRLSTYEQCPNKFKLQYVDKTYKDDSDNPAFVRGSKIHKQCENYINFCKKKGTKPSMSVEAENAVPLINGIIGNFKEVHAEQKLSLNTKFGKCDWFSKATMYRAILDMVAIGDDKAVIIDFKTGKVREYDDKPTGQLHLASCFIFANYPNIQEVSTAYAFLDHKITLPKVFTRDEFDSMKETFRGMFDKVNMEKEWTPKVNSYCHWCLATKDQCKFK
jgi:hypothetical protein